MSTDSQTTNDVLQLLSVDTLAQLLELSTRQVRRLDVTGKVPKPFKIGRSVRWRRSEILAWLEAGMPERGDWEIIKRETRNSKPGLRLRDARRFNPSQRTKGILD